MADEENQRGVRLVVGGCSNGSFAHLLNGFYEESGWHHEKLFFKKNLGVQGSEVCIYFWDGRDNPAMMGWWFGPVLGGGTAWAFACSSAKYPPESGWAVNHDGSPKADPLFISKLLPPELLRTQSSTQSGQTHHTTGDEYVEWRRILPYDDILDAPSDTSTFLRLCKNLGLYVNPSDKKIEGNKCTLSLRSTSYGAG